MPRDQRATLTADAHDRNRRQIDLYALAALLLVVLVAQQRLNEGVTSDGNLYFAYLRSLVFDHDLQIGPELAAVAAARNAKYPPSDAHATALSAIGSSNCWLLYSSAVTLETRELPEPS